MREGGFQVEEGELSAMLEPWNDQEEVLSTDRIILKP